MRPAFCVATAHLDLDDRSAAVDLGIGLCDHLTRDRRDPLAFGAGIPVYIGMRADGKDEERFSELADCVLLVVVASARPLLRALDELAKHHLTLYALPRIMTVTTPPAKH